MNYIVKIIFNEDGTSAWKYHSDMISSDVLWSKANISTKLEAVWYAVVEFIKWYNENKNK